ncbi:hypothetical protein [Haloglomus litoreum]|uniref:hypothetical protein n=1 Tax=Haloglomus litoreum TaxID=3034026 RepID=UPI0023E79695|nr:hypothetical protein [Haloglomus sp. DT116]
MSPDPLAPDVPASGTTLLTGPSNAGKTRRTAAALREYVARHGRGGVVVLDFAPTVVRDGRVLGGRLDRFEVPRVAWTGTLVAHAPRAESEGDPDRALALARANARNAARLLDATPPARAVFVNDATIPFQATGDPSPLFDVCADAEVIVANAFDGDLGDGAVSEAERDALGELTSWANRRVDLPRPD